VASAAGRLDLRGGHPVIDFVNTVAWRGDAPRRTDYLVDYADLVAWCRHADVVSAADAEGLAGAAGSDLDSARRTLGRAVRLRESLHALWTGGAPSALATVTDAYVSAVRHRELRLNDDGVAWAEREMTVCSPVDRLAIGAVEVLTEVPLDRVKRCDDAACGWLFVDGSHRQNRRWCSTADCGNRDRARRHYERSRER
jgi:predicted RNA-binding Zn ribbon-like protein